MSTKYIARYNGKIVGQRTTKNRSYAFAVVVQSNEESYRAKAYGWQPDDQDRKNFDYYTIEAAGQSKYDWCRTPEAIAKAQDVVAGGWDGYVQRERQKLIDRFEEMRAKGGFEPAVATWCSRRDLADKASTSSQYVGSYYAGRIDFVAIVPAEEVK